MKLLDIFRNPSASSVMIRRYCIADAEGYRADHRLLVLGAVYLGIAMMGFVSAGLILVPGPDAPIGLMLGSVVIMFFAMILLARLVRGEEA
jgi:hypothetical protein